MSDWLSQLQVDKSWTLFLDRDGVLNRRLIDAYVRNWSEWEWLPGVKSALAVLAKKFGWMFLVTNQRGVARGLMTEADLGAIHIQMFLQLSAAGGRLDAIYYCPHERDAGCDCRKPGPGMVHQALKTFPDVNLEQAIMVGDSVSDMEMAFPLGIRTVFIGELPEELVGRVDACCASLAEFAAAITKSEKPK